MEVSVINKTKNELEIEIRGANETLLGPLMNHTLANPDVDYASYYMGHIVLDSPKFYVRTKKGTPKKAIQKAKMPKEVEKKCMAELKKLKNMSPINGQTK